MCENKKCFKDESNFRLVDNMRSLFFIGFKKEQYIKIPKDVYYIRVKFFGGGGGGGGGSRRLRTAFSSGGGGAAMIESALSVKPGEVYTIIVGGGGKGGYPGEISGLDGESGGDTILTGNGVLMIAGGGAGSKGVSGPNLVNGRIPAAAGGRYEIKSGGIGGFGANGTNGTPLFGALGGAASGGGNGGYANTFPSDASGPGQFPGGGGSGAAVGGTFTSSNMANPGGDGADGLFIVYYSSPAEIQLLQ